MEVMILVRVTQVHHIHRYKMYACKICPFLLSRKPVNVPGKLLRGNLKYERNHGYLRLEKLPKCLGECRFVAKPPEPRKDEVFFQLAILSPLLRVSSDCGEVKVAVLASLSQATNQKL
eukprot:g2371.t1